MTYLMYKIYLEKCNKEGFADTPAQSLGGVDDTNAINTLAQISKQLMAGGVTVPGSINLNGDITFLEAKTIAGKARLHIAGEELLYILNKAGVIIGKEWGGNGNLTVQGDVVVKGRNILAELDKLNSRWKGEDLTVGGRLTVNNGSNFNGGRHWFKDEENAGRLRVGAAYGIPGIWGEDTGGLVQVANFQIGTQRAGDNNTGGMVADKNYDFIRSRNPSYAMLGPSNTGQLGMAWNNGRMYWTFLEKNQRNWNSDYGNLVN